MNTRSKTKKRLPEMEEDTIAYDQFQFSQQTNSQLSITLSANFTPPEILCRDEEKRTISDFLKECLNSQGQAGSRVLYISGVPGVGKTAATLQIISNFRKKTNKRKFTYQYINAMSLNRPKDIYFSLYEKLFKKQQGKVKKSKIILTLQEKLVENSKVKVVVIDQVDFLMTPSQEIYYNLFEWANDPETKLCFIIIANTMDFPEKLMPKITSRMGSRRLVFAPYSQKQIQQIIEQRLLNSKRFTEDAIVYACKKMSSFTSDLRKILNVLKKSTQQENLTAIIDVPVILRNWRLVSEQACEDWQQQFNQTYKLILSIIKQKGGRANQQQIKSHLSDRITQTQLEYILNQLNQLNIIKTKLIKKHGYRMYEATLIKI